MDIKQTAEDLIAQGKAALDTNADGDGKVSVDEVKVVAEGIADKATKTVNDIVGKIKGE